MTSIDDKVHTLQARAQALHHTQARALDSIHTTAQQQLHTLQQHQPCIPAAPGPPLPSDPAVLVAELQSLHVGAAQTHRLQALQASVRALDKAVHSVERAQASADPLSGFVDHVGAAVSAYSAALPDVQAFHAAVTDAGILLPDIVTAGHALVDRVDAAQHTLRGAIAAQLAQRLGQLGWPPAGLPTAGLPSTPPLAFDGFLRPEHQPIMHEVQQLLGAMTMLQRAVQPDAFAAALEGGSMEGPTLWGMRAVSQPLGHVLIATSDAVPGGAVTAPERVFQRALQLAAAVAPLVAPLQQVFDALGLTAAYDTAFETARSVREELKDLLRMRMLPDLLARQQPGLWKHLADHMLHFEHALAPMHGIALGLDGSVPGRLPDGLLGLLFESPAWTDAWLAAELQALQGELDAVCDSDEGWAPLARLFGGEAEGGTRWASAHEFFPPYCADVAVGLVTAAVRRSAWCDTRVHQRRYLKHVAGQLLKAFRARLQRTGTVAEGYRDLTGPRWGPRLATCICAAHYMEHQLREPEVAALLATDAEEGPTPASSPAQGGDGRQSSSTGSLVAILERESAGFGWLKREWTLKMARATADGFAEATKQYRRQLQRFSDPAARADPPPSPPLVAGLEQLQATLRMLGEHLDAVAFRELWRAVAVAANQLLFNDVVTEATFSPAGLQQLSTDVDAVAALFGSFTRRPLAHFRELDEARRLLLLPPAEAAGLQAALQQEQGGQQARQALAAINCTRLNDVQAMAVLMALQLGVTPNT